MAEEVSRNKHKNPRPASEIWGEHGQKLLGFISGNKKNSFGRNMLERVPSTYL